MLKTQDGGSRNKFSSFSMRDAELVEIPNAVDLCDRGL
jgi:hypothetical protein